jgi:hydrogenase-4 component E
VVLLMTIIYLLGTSRLAALIRTVGIQGILLGLVPIFCGESLEGVHIWIITLSSLCLKGVAIPLMLLRALRGVALSRETKPAVSFTLSSIIGVVIVLFSYVVHRTMLVMPLFASPLIPAAMAMALCGLFLIIARRQALTQVIGYLVFENGIYLFGLAISAKNPLLVELGVLLDVFVGVFVMGIVIYHINREFDSISVEDLRMLKE